MRVGAAMRRRACLVATAVIAAVVLACAGAYHWFTHAVEVPFGFELEARFETFPADDEPLKEWLRRQWGVIPHLVAVGRFGDDKKLLVVTFSQVRNLAGEPPLPDLDAVCKELGYRNPDGRFRDSVDRERSFPYP
jgi:hypothetical protein